MKTSCKVWNIKVHRVSSYCLSKEKSTQSHENESFLKGIFSCFKVTSKWYISIYLCPSTCCVRRPGKTWTSPPSNPADSCGEDCAQHCEGKNSQLIFSSNFKIILHRCRSTDPVFTQWPCKEGQTPFTKKIIKKVNQRFSMILNL